MNYFNILKSSVVLFILGCSYVAHAFPDTIRHGYTNCTSCHVSPGGGGLLTSYGRSLSNELMSTWSVKDEEQLLHGLVKVPDSWLDKVFLGGDVRYLSKSTRSETEKEDEGFLMQAQLRMGVAYNKVKLLMSVGKIENPRMSREIKFVSPEYYAIWNLKEELYIRAGRFEPIFGLRMPDHNLWIKSEIGLVPWLERDSIEFIYEGEAQFLSLAGYQSSSATNPLQQVTGYTTSFYQTVFDTSQIGLSGMNSEGQGTRQRSLSLHSTLSFSERTYLQFEHSRAWLNETIKDLSFVRLGHEVVKGLTVLTQVQAKQDPLVSGADQMKYGIGFNWLPRPHFELTGLIEQSRHSDEISNEGMMLLHYYF